MQELLCRVPMRSHGQYLRPPQSCDLNNCAGTFDSNGKATCKNFFAGCQCLPSGDPVGGGGDPVGGGSGGDPVGGGG